MNLEKYKWKSRILFVSTPNYKEKKYLNVKKIYQEKIKEFHKRYIKLICKTDKKNNFSIDLIEFNGESKKKLDAFSNNWHEKFLNFIKDRAKKNKTDVIIGSIPYRKKNLKFLNRSIVVDSRGIEISYYDKINLFNVNLGSKEKYLESKNYDSGREIKVAKLSYGNLGLSICYDIRFPILYRKLVKKGADFISIPAAFTHTTGLAHWHSLIRARAIENGCFIFAPAQVGLHENGRRTYGHSMIVDPWGKVISSATNKRGIIYASVDKTLVKKSREKIPSMTSFF